MFLVIQPIFIPAPDKAERYFNSIYSLGKYFNKFYKDDNRILFAFGGWCFNNEYWQKAESIIKEYFPLAPCIRYERNVGKAIIVNELSKQYNWGQPYLMSVDSDIIFPEYTPWLWDRLDRMFKISEEIRKIPVGVIGLQQDENGVHYASIYDNQFEYKSTHHGKVFDERIVWPNIRGGIGGGCLAISMALWQKIGGYRVMGVYSSDDGKILQDARRNNFSIQVSDSIAIIHPKEDDPEYLRWKGRVVHQTTRTGIKNDISKEMAEADAYWASRRK
jgi:hypothetical protein